jgi:hypothetical protein
MVRLRNSELRFGPAARSSSFFILIVTAGSSAAKSTFNTIQIVFSRNTKYMRYARVGYRLIL